MGTAARADNRAVLQSLVSLAVTLVIMGVLLFRPAGTFDWPAAWWFAAAFLVWTLLAVVIIWRGNPEIFVARFLPSSQGCWLNLLQPELEIADQIVHILQPDR